MGYYGLHVAMGCYGLLWVAMGDHGALWGAMCYDGEPYQTLLGAPSQLQPLHTASRGKGTEYERTALNMMVRCGLAELVASILGDGAGRL